MPTPQIFISYIPAQVSDKQICRVYYYAVHPQTNRLQRVVIKCNRIKAKRLRLEYARKLAEVINKKLSNGWNPFLEQEAAKPFTTLTTACDVFLAEKKREQRADSIRAYTSYIGMFKNWLDLKRPPSYYVISFTPADAVDYLDFVYLKKKVSARTYNNYVVFYRTLFNWFIAHAYSKANPFEKFIKKREQPKKRILIPREIRDKITNHLLESNPSFLCYLMIIYHCLLRPKEILYTKVKDFDLVGQTIRVDADVAKNHKERFATIPDGLLPYLYALNFSVQNPDYYLFSVGLQPGKMRWEVRAVDKYWDRLRKNLGLPMEMQMYSLRDSGITEALNAGIPINMVKEHADHHDLAMTSIYAAHKNPEAHEVFKTRAPEF